MPIYSIHASNIKFEIFLKKGNDWPKFTLDHYYSLDSEESIDSNTKKISISIDDPKENIVLNYFNKTNKDTHILNDQIIYDQNLNITKMQVNDIFIDLKLLQNFFCFAPKIDINYITSCKRENKPLSKILYTTELYFNGTLTFNFKQPFFQWYNEKQIESLEDMNHWLKYSHLGFADKNKIHKLEKILNLLNK